MPLVPSVIFNITNKINQMLLEIANNEKRGKNTLGYTVIIP